MLAFLSKLGSPFRRGTLSSLILGAMALAFWIWFYFEMDTKPVWSLAIIAGALFGLGRSVFLYRKLNVQHGIELIDDKA